MCVIIERYHERLLLTHSFLDSSLHKRTENNSSKLRCRGPNTTLCNGLLLGLKRTHERALKFIWRHDKELCSRKDWTLCSHFRLLWAPRLICSPSAALPALNRLILCSYSLITSLRAEFSSLQSLRVYVCSCENVRTGETHSQSVASVNEEDGSGYDVSNTCVCVMSTS